MSGTKEGAKKAVSKIKDREPNFYARIALQAQKAWDRNGRKPQGFAANRELARRAGRLGGMKSRRTKEVE
jgi:hypothetical protein